MSTFIFAVLLPAVAVGYLASTWKGRNPGAWGVGSFAASLATGLPLAFVAELAIAAGIRQGTVTPTPDLALGMPLVIGGLFVLPQLLVLCVLAGCRPIADDDIIGRRPPTFDGPGVR